MKNALELKDSFKPPFWMRPSMVQTLIASLKFRKSGTHAVQDRSIEMILHCGTDQEGCEVRLMGSYTHNPRNKALVIFLHGWEGSQDSTYVVSTARRVYDQGASVFRLNYRDHGGTHHLNEGIFLATRFDEISNAVSQAAELSGGAKVYIVGFSLGGNFALRLARSLKKSQIEIPYTEIPDTEIPDTEISGKQRQPERLAKNALAKKNAELNVSHIFAISPVIDPWAAAPLVDKNYFIQRYFKKKLQASYSTKQALFPDLYDFSLALSRKTIMEASADILLAYSEHDTLERYFSAYGIKPDDLSGCETPTSIIMAEDDPVVPAAHLDALILSPQCRNITLKYGGHNGFFQSLNGPTWYDEYMANIIFEQNI